MATLSWSEGGGAIAAPPPLDRVVLEGIFCNWNRIQKSPLYSLGVLLVIWWWSSTKPWVFGWRILTLSTLRTGISSFVLPFLILFSSLLNQHVVLVGPHWIVLVHNIPAVLTDYCVLGCREYCRRDGFGFVWPKNSRFFIPASRIKRYGFTREWVALWLICKMFEIPVTPLCVKKYQINNNLRMLVALVAAAEVFLATSCCCSSLMPDDQPSICSEDDLLSKSSYKDIVCDGINEFGALNLKVNKICFDSCCCDNDVSSGSFSGQLF